MKDIAARADVGAGTLSHHFPTYEDVVRACGARMRAETRPPEPEEFASIPEPDRRIERLAQAPFAYYARHPPFERARCDRHQLPVLADAVTRLEQHLQFVVRAAPGDHGADENLVRLVTALTDFAVYRTLTACGTSLKAAAAQVAEVLVIWLAR